MAAACAQCGTAYKDYVVEHKEEMSQCSGCKSVLYCDKDCQKSHWKEHKNVCKQIKALRDGNKGFLKVVTKEGNKEKIPKVGQEAVIHYTGYLPSGKVFDSSRDKEPLTCLLGAGAVIRGVDEGVRSMVQGECATLYISPAYGYGEERKGTIPPNSYLIFDVELLGFRDADLAKTGTNFL